MPPLLPEYLREPVQVIVESSISVDTDWWTIAGTVAGTLAGALLGGLVAYRGTIRANKRALKREKAEQAYIGIMNCIALVKNCDRYRAENSKAFALGEKNHPRDLPLEAEKALQAGTEAFALLALYFNGYDQDAAEISEKLYDWNKAFYRSLSRDSADTPWTRIIPTATVASMSRFYDAKNSLLGSLDTLANKIRENLN